MDLLRKENELNLDDPTRKIYTEDASALPAYIGPEASVETAYLTQGSEIDGEVKRSVIFTDTVVEAGAKVIDSVLMPGAKVAAGAVVTRALVANNVKIGKNAVVGSADSEEILLVAKNVKGDE
jgi:glucose-1-phosphate adenylyltransferase